MVGAPPVQLMKKSSSFRRGGMRSRPPSLNTVWEWQPSDIIERVPTQDEVLSADQAADGPLRGRLLLRSSWSWSPLRLPWQSESWSECYAILMPAQFKRAPSLLLFKVRIQIE